MTRSIRDIIGPPLSFTARNGRRYRRVTSAREHVAARARGGHAWQPDPLTVEQMERARAAWAVAGLDARLSWAQGVALVLGEVPANPYTLHPGGR